MQLLSLIPILILLLYVVVSLDLVYTGLCELFLGVYREIEQPYSKFVIAVTTVQVVTAITNKCKC